MGKSWMRGSELYEEIYHIESDEYKDLYGIGMEDHPDPEKIAEIRKWEFEWNFTQFR